MTLIRTVKDLRGLGTEVLKKELEAYIGIELYSKTERKSFIIDQIIFNLDLAPNQSYSDYRAIGTIFVSPVYLDRFYIERVTTVSANVLHLETFDTFIEQNLKPMLDNLVLDFKTEYVKLDTEMAKILYKKD